VTVPLATTTITVLRPVAGDPYEPSETPPATVTTGIRAHISTPNVGNSRIVGGQQSVVEPRLACDPCDFTFTDLVRDDTTGQVYGVSWVQRRIGLGLDHMEAGLRFVEGAA